MTDKVLLDCQDGIAILTLNRPKKRNALTGAMSRQIIAFCEEIDQDHSLGAVVVRGAGRSFCAGADRAILKKASQDPVREDHFQELGVVYNAFFRIGSLTVPVVAAVRGAAVGAGMNLLLAADLRVVAQDARLIAGFLRIAIHPGGGHFALMRRLAGPEAAAAMAIFGQEINGQRAVELGIAWEALADEEVEARAVELAAHAARDPLLARKAVHSLRHFSDVPWEAALEAERSVQMWSLRRRFESDSGQEESKATRAVS